MATINLAAKYASQIENVFGASSFVKPNTDEHIDFSGAQEVKVYTLQTNKPTTYKRNGGSRYGNLEEIGETVQNLRMSQDTAFCGTVDKGNAADQPIKNKASAWIREEIRLEITPMADKYALSRFIRFGHVATVTAEPTKTNIHDELTKCVEYFDDHLVPESDRVLYVTAKMYSYIRMAPEFLGVDKLGEASLSRGTVGEVHGMKVVKVPASYLPANCYFVATNKKSVIFPYKINETKVHTDPVGVSGAVVEGRQYYDAFVMAAKCDGVYALVKASEKLAAPTLECATPGTTPVTVKCSGANEIRYTTDGSDPRFSDSAKLTSGSVGTTGWQAGDTVFRAVGFADGKFTSDVAEQTFTKA
ncbi:FN3 associated domain-containing protein [Intestinibacillus massiliensis]|uniref:FN3 associated domain-containing protein n=1 Tax=Intestinibacillus massiliensis TaxID=1871029 RepID=UPI000B35E5B5|nr:FN3 associated domain-containing protein [Intestinibacillus massiliensis]